MLTKDRNPPLARRRLDPGGWRWWAVTGSVSLLATAAGGFAGFVLYMELIPGMGEALSRPWVEVPMVLAPLVLSGLVIGLVGGLRRWRLLVPAVVLPAVVFLSVPLFQGNLVAIGVLSMAAGLYSTEIARQKLEP